MSEQADSGFEVLMPEAERQALELAYSEAKVILEYGCGGSTVVAAQLPGKTVYSVESDQAWVTRMRDWFAQHPPAQETHIDLNWVDIGPTREWGRPKNDRGWRRYASYPLGIWSKPGFRQPDVVLVDGRFRVGCALATAYRTTRPVTLLFDDYKRREQYHCVETYIGQPFIVGRMAVFEIEPTPLPVEQLADIIKMMTQP